MAQRSAGPQPLIVTGQNIRDGASSGRRGGARLLRGGFAKRQLRSTLTPAHNNEGDKNMCTNLHDNARQYAEEKNERLLLACRPAGIHSGGGSFSGLDIFL
jgi:hypothetical protein